MTFKDICLIEAPSNLGLMPPAPGQEPGVSGLPGALEAAGLAARLAVVATSRVEPPPYSPYLDHQIGIRNAAAIRTYSTDLAAEVGQVVSARRFPIVLGGDCSILLGNLLALKQLGRFGLFFIDGHTDFGTPETSQTGGAAGMDLALVCGYGPPLLVAIDGQEPLVQERDVIIFGNRDIQDRATYAWREVFETEISHYPLETIRELGVEQACHQALSKLDQQNLNGLWIHLDADVLDDEIMPAVDSRQPGGLRFAELSRLLGILLSSGMATGLEITIFDPSLDPDGGLAQAFVEAIVTGFSDFIEYDGA